MEGVTLEVGLLEGVMDAVPLLLGVLLFVGELEGVVDGEGVPLGVLLGVGLLDGVLLPVEDDEGVLVAVGLGVGTLIARLNNEKRPLVTVATTLTGTLKPVLSVPLIASGSTRDQVKRPVSLLIVAPGGAVEREYSTLSLALTGKASNWTSSDENAGALRVLAAGLTNTGTSAPSRRLTASATQSCVCRPIATLPLTPTS